MSAGYYIYYRIPAERVAEAKRIVSALQAELLQETGVQGRLLHRRDDPSTWMEIYEGVADEKAFHGALDAVVGRSGFAAVLAPGSRRVTEVFGPF
jgi:hypothetical protein